MTTNDTLQQSLMSQLIQTQTVRSITNTGRKHDSQILRMSALEKGFLDAYRKFLRMSGSDKTANSDSSAIRNHGNCLFNTYYFTQIDDLLCIISCFQCTTTESVYGNNKLKNLLAYLLENFLSFVFSRKQVIP